MWNKWKKRKVTWRLCERIKLVTKILTLILLRKFQCPWLILPTSKKIKLKFLLAIWNNRPSIPTSQGPDTHHQLQLETIECTITIIHNLQMHNITLLNSQFTIVITVKVVENILLLHRIDIKFIRVLLHNTMCQLIMNHELIMKFLQGMLNLLTLHLPSITIIILKPTTTRT